MGLDLKRSDTPVVIQQFLSQILESVLLGHDADSVIQQIRDFKSTFAELPPWEKGSPKRVNNLSKYTAMLARHKKDSEETLRIPGHVRAAINWNMLRRANNDNYSMAITDGMKTVVCKLARNPMGFTSIAYPTDEHRLPGWFTELSFDDETMADTVIDKKVDNLLGVMGWNIADKANTKTTFATLFEF
jgi:hypothetical protein